MLIYFQVSNITESWTDSTDDWVSESFESTSKPDNMRQPIAIIETHDTVFIISFFLRNIESIFGILGNGIILMAFQRYPDLRNATGYLICGLSVADLIGSVLAPMMVMLAFYRNTNVWVPVCHIKLFIIMTYTLGNVFFSMSIAIERLLTLSYPLSYQTFITPNRTAVFTIICWAYIILFGITTHVIVSDHLKTVVHSHCLIWNCLTPPVQFVFLSHLYIFTIVIFIIYILIGRIAWNVRNKLKTEATRIQWKITKMMGTIMLIYGVFYIPLMVVDRLMRAYPHEKSYTRAYYIYSVTFIINTWINPFLYVSHNPPLRSAVRKLLPKCIAQRVLKEVHCQ